jgi:single-strand DNA-binding protein
MASENTVTIVGNLTDDPELRYTPSGAAVVNFTVAVNKRFRNNDGQWEDRLDGFFRCSCWRDMAEHVTESLVKGARVMVVGRLQQRSWETNDGQKRYEIEIQADEVGPSLRWATANVQKSQRSSGSGGFGGGQGGGQGGPSGPPQQAPAERPPVDRPQQDSPAPAADDWGASADVDRGGF